MRSKELYGRQKDGYRVRTTDSNHFYFPSPEAESWPNGGASP